MGNHVPILQNLQNFIYAKNILSLGLKNVTSCISRSEINFLNIMLSDQSWGNEAGLIILLSVVLGEERLNSSLVTRG